MTLDGSGGRPLGALNTWCAGPLPARVEAALSDCFHRGLAEVAARLGPVDPAASEEGWVTPRRLCRPR